MGKSTFWSESQTCDFALKYKSKWWSLFLKTTFYMIISMSTISFILDWVYKTCILTTTYSKGIGPGPICCCLALYLFHYPDNDDVGLLEWEIFVKFIWFSVTSKKRMEIKGFEMRENLSVKVSNSRGLKERTLWQYISSYRFIIPS